MNRPFKCLKHITEQNSEYVSSVVLAVNTGEVSLIYSGNNLNSETDK